MKQVTSFLIASLAASLWGRRAIAALFFAAILFPLGHFLNIPVFENAVFEAGTIGVTAIALGLLMMRARAIERSERIRFEVELQEVRNKTERLLDEERRRSNTLLKNAKNELDMRVRERTADLQRTLGIVDFERRRFNDVLEMLPVYVILLNTDYQVLFANRYFREHFGEANGRQCFSYLFGRDGPCENCETFKVLRTHVPHHWEWVGPDGRNYDIYDFIFPGAGASPLIMEMGIDITDRKRAEAALLEANEMKLLGQLTSGVAHEVRNPLNGIIAIAEALSLEFSDSSRFEPFINHMRLQVTRLTSLMEELLTLGRPLRQETLNEISMVTLVETSLTTWLETLPARPMVQFIKPESPEKYKIKADTNTMAQVIINLLENAHNHSPRDEEIVCSVFELTAQMLVVFRIKDRGCGIAKNNVSRIFDPFFTTRKGGTGLGLSIVRHVVENHKGSVYAYNNTDGPGATFEVVLPMCVS